MERSVLGHVHVEPQQIRQEHMGIDGYLARRQQGLGLKTSTVNDNIILTVRLRKNHKHESRIDCDGACGQVVSFG